MPITVWLYVPPVITYCTLLIDTLSVAEASRVALVPVRVVPVTGTVTAVTGGVLSTTTVTPAL